MNTTEDIWNDLGKIKKALGTAERPIENDEFQRFWSSLNAQEREEYRRAKLD